ncbi:MAG: class I SAM-dependent methyltransferase [Alphaproteobacteria bacterium]
MKCRHCHQELEHIFLDLGFAPPSNAYLKKEDLSKPERYFPLNIKVCSNCWLVQTEDYADADELFDAEYAYFSSTSQGWLNHAKQYCDMITNKLNLNENSLAVEVASNDGYLLKNFVEAGIPCLGIEPTKSTADASKKLNIPVVEEFFGENLAIYLISRGKKADLIIGNNVYAHVPDINDFTKGLKILLKDDGVITLEFPHLLNLINLNQFDTVYHEHYSYLSLGAVSAIFQKQGLKVFDVEKLPTHGGSLRVYGCHNDCPKDVSNAVKECLKEEIAGGLQQLETYKAFQLKANKIKNDLVKFLIDCNEQNKKVAAYGAAAKGNTLLNYGGVKTDLLPFVCDAAPSKQNKYMPASHIPILAPEAIKEYKPDYVVILPWNIAEEVTNKLSYIKEWGGKFVTAVPELKVW